MKIKTIRYFSAESYEKDVKRLLEKGWTLNSSGYSNGNWWAVLCKESPHN